MEREGKEESGRDIKRFRQKREWKENWRERERMPGKKILKRLQLFNT